MCPYVYLKILSGYFGIISGYFGVIFSAFFSKNPQSNGELYASQVPESAWKYQQRPHI